jgi:hypothetical protein
VSFEESSCKPCTATQEIVHEPKDSIELNKQLQVYFEDVVNLWLAFLPEPNKATFPRNFSFPVTVPFSFLGELPAEMQGDVRQLQVNSEAFDRPIPEVVGKQSEGEGKRAKLSSGQVALSACRFHNLYESLAARRRRESHIGPHAD